VGVPQPGINGGTLGPELWVIWLSPLARVVFGDKYPSDVLSVRDLRAELAPYSVVVHLVGKQRPHFSQIVLQPIAQLRAVMFDDRRIGQ
jgi:hypothetical protein